MPTQFTVTLEEDGISLYNPDTDQTTHVDIPDIDILGLDPQANDFHQNFNITKLKTTADQDIVSTKFHEQPAPESVLDAGVPYSWLNWWDEPKTNGSQTDIDLIGTVTHYMDTLGRDVIVNVTEPGHTLYPGMVIRQLYTVNDDYYIVSVGIGNGDWIETNNTLGPGTWAGSAESISREAELEQYARDYSLDPVDQAYKDYANALLGKEVPNWYQMLLDYFAGSKQQSSPLVLDIAGTGINLAEVGEEGSVYWQHDPSSDFANASGWIAEGTGLLAIDLNENGIIDNHSELFGTTTTDGFTVLDAYDSNSDDVIDDTDADWDDLLVWLDSNQNGYSEEEELFTLDELLITEIDLGYTTSDYYIAGNHITHESTFTIDGQTHDIVDTWFTYDTGDTEFVGNHSLDPFAYFAPTLKGYGEVPDFHIALSLDNDLQDADSLISLMTALLDSDYSTLGVENDPMPFYAAVEKIMLRWAGVDDVVSDSRGNFIDARYLEFVEKITGQAFTQLEGGDDPLAGPAPIIMEAWGTAHQAIAARLAYQLMNGHELFEGSPIYITVTDAFGDSTGVDFDALETFLTHTDYLDHLTAARLAVSWTEEIIGFDNLTTQEKADFEDLLPQNVTLDALLADVQYASTSATGYLYGDANDNFMVTPSTTEETVQNFSAGAGNDLLISGSATQSVYAYDGNDVMIAGTGRQTLLGYDGDDLYVFAPGTGQMDGSYYNTIQESASNGTDTLRITGGVEADDVYAWTTSNGYLYVQYTDTDFVRATASATGGASRVGERLEKIVFDDETEWDLTTGLTLHNNDTSRTFYGSTSNDVMIAGGGADKLYGKGGDDILESGGGSADWLYGDAGADTFRFMEDTAYDALDLIQDFDAVEGDAIDIADLLTGYNPISDTISDFVSLTESGGHTTLAVDKDGTGGTYSFTDVARLTSTTGLDLNDMITNGELLIA